MYQSQTYGKLELTDVPAKILEYFERNKDFEEPFQITVGTDSQNFSDTKMVSVIAVTCQGHGGIFFYEISHIDKIMDVRRKLTEETTRSLEVMETLVSILEQDQYKTLRDNITLAIHVDAGWSEKGKTKELIPMLVGWIKGIHPEIQTLVKPQSWAASTVADRISK